MAARSNPHFGEEEIFRSASQRESATPPHTNDLLYRLVESDDVDRRRDAAGRAGNPVFVEQGLFGVAHDQDRDIGSLPYRQDRVGTGRRRAAEIENDDIRLAAADEVKKKGLDKIGLMRHRSSVLRSPGYRQVLPREYYGRRRAHSELILV